MKAVLTPVVVWFAAEQTTSEQPSSASVVVAEGKVTVESPAIAEHAVPAPLSPML